MIPQTHLKVLYKLYERLKDSNVNWVVTGGLGFGLQGVLVEPHDIDIQTDKEGAYEIERLFSEFVVKPVKFRKSERIRSHFGALMIEGVRVEIMGRFKRNSMRSGNPRWT